MSGTYGSVSELFCLVERHFGLDRQGALADRRPIALAARAAMAVRLRALEGRSNAEIGRVIECDPSTVSYLVNHRNRLARVAPEAFVAVSEAP